ncbi:MAG: signal peptidase II [Deltaproteobacteria bacterium]|nr:signal peptidase II [Deltaproteobacteria bacterium]
MKKTYFLIPWVSFWVVLDQVTKYLISVKLELHESLALIPGFLSFTFIYNEGGAFGFLSGQSEVLRNLIFVLIPIFVIGLIVYLCIKAPSHQKLHIVSLGLVLAGAFGNMIDRLWLGKVRDFIDFDLSFILGFFYHWPAFNVADSTICVGVFLLAYHMLFLDKKDSASL